MLSLQLKSIQKSFDIKSIPALRSLELEVAEGEWLGIMGPSGTGKSTLLKIMSGLLPADSGEVVVSGVANPYELVSYLPQGLEFEAGKTVFELLQGKVKGADERERYHQARELIDLFSLHYKDETQPSELSFGQKQRLAFAMALAKKPKWLLLDEPFSHLDELLREELKDELKKILKEREVGVVLVTHDLRDILNDCQRVCLLHWGEFYQVGAPMELYLKPRDSFVARFFGRSNLIMSKIVERMGEQKYIVSNEYGDFEFRATIPMSERAAHGIVFGRPESVVISRDKGEHSGVIVGVEHKENVNVLEIKTSSGKLYASDGQRQYQKGESVFFSFQREKLVLISA